MSLFPEMHCTKLRHKQKKKPKNRRSNGTPFLRSHTRQTQRSDGGDITITRTANSIAIQDTLTTDNTSTRVSELTADTLQPNPPLFPSLQHTVQQNENHYEISDIDSNQYHYAISSGVSTFTSIGSNHATQGNVDPESTASAFDEAHRPTMQTECGHRWEMINRPLPHRPFSVGVPECRSLPPRLSYDISSSTHPTTSGGNARLNNSHVGVRLVDDNSRAGEVQPGTLNIISSTITQHKYSIDADKGIISKTDESMQHVTEFDIIKPDSLTPASALTLVRGPTSDTVQHDQEQKSVISQTLFPPCQQAFQQCQNHMQIETPSTDSNPYHYAIGSDIRLDMPEDNAYEKADTPTVHMDSRNDGNRTEMMSMLNRPLPHRPIFVGIPEGPTLPPRTKHGPISSSTTSTLNASLKNSHTGTCSVEYNSITDEVKFQLGSSVIMNSNNAQRHCLREEGEHIVPRISGSTQHVADTNFDPAASSRASAYHGYYSADDLQLGEGNNGAQIPLSNPDPFYHCLENDNPEGCSNADVLLEYGSNDNDDDRDACNNNAMVDNILYNPLPF